MVVVNVSGAIQAMRNVHRDCNGVYNIDAFWDDCGICSGGDTDRNQIAIEVVLESVSEILYQILLRVVV